MGMDGDWVRSGERRLGLDVDTSTGLISVELVRTHDFEAFELTSAEPVIDVSSQTELACAVPGESFQLDWITNGRCGLDELDGSRLVLEVQ